MCEGRQRCLGHHNGAQLLVRREECPCLHGDHGNHPVPDDESLRTLDKHREEVCLARRKDVVGEPRQQRPHIPAAHVRRIRYHDRVSRRQVLSLEYHPLRQPEYVGTKDVATIVKLSKMLLETSS